MLGERGAQRDTVANVGLDASDRRAAQLLKSSDDAALFEKSSRTTGTAPDCASAATTCEPT
jgi:hypothetical protein